MGQTWILVNKIDPDHIKGQTQAGASEINKLLFGQLGRVIRIEQGEFCNATLEFDIIQPILCKDINLLRPNDNYFLPYVKKEKFYK